MPKITQARLHLYERLIRLYDGELCWVCGSPPRTRRLNIDYCHTTGFIRGLLCYRCNRGLQWFDDSPDRFRKSVDYLEFSLWRRKRQKPPKAAFL